ncbi:Uncharacterized protein Adt_49217 [Abeliophyllum distichum]|uniref:Uncharacterized protein n=1 Tax=Abeliophyllum distichum TaxID=126358 RepID=A0ABD1NNV4_9LAMI
MADVILHESDGAGHPPHQPPCQLDSLYKSTPMSKQRDICQGINFEKVPNRNRPLFIAFNNVEHTKVPQEQRAWFCSIIESYFDLQDDQSLDEYWAMCAAVDCLADDHYRDKKT